MYIVTFQKCNKCSSFFNFHHSIHTRNHCFLETPQPFSNVDIQCSDKKEQIDYDREDAENKDGIGDKMVTLIILDDFVAPKFSNEYAEKSHFIE